MSLRSLLAVTVGLITVTAVQAQVTPASTWNGVSNSDFSNSANWSSGVPNSNLAATFGPTAATQTVILSTPSSALGINYLNASSYTIFGEANTLNITGPSSPAFQYLGIYMNDGSASQVINTVSGMGVVGQLQIGNSANQNSQQVWEIDANSLTVNGVIGDGGNNIAIRKTGAGTLVFGDKAGINTSNTFTGVLDIAQGAVRLANNNKLTDNGTVVLENAGKLDFGGFSEGDGGVLSFTGTSSSLSFNGNGNGFASQSMTFDSILASPSGNLLTITGWTGIANSTGQTGRIFSTSAVDAMVLSQIQFAGFVVGAIQIAGGEIVPVPEPTITLAVAGLGMVGIRGIRRRLAKTTEPAVV